MATTNAPPHSANQGSQKYACQARACSSASSAASTTRLDEPASDAEHAAVDGEPDRRRPSQRPSSPRPGPRREVTDADEDERRDGANQFQHDDHPQNDD